MPIPQSPRQEHQENFDAINNMYVQARDDVDTRLIEHWNPTIPHDERTFDPNDFSKQYKTMADLYRIASGYARQNEENRDLDNISKDAVTETLIPQAFTKLMEGLDKDGTLETINKQGWSLQISLFDLDKLGQHNDLGGQAGGDTALKSITDVLKQSFRRNGGAEGQDLPAGSPLPTISEHREQIKHAVTAGKMHDVITRLGGDEFLVISFMPKDQDQNREKKPDLVSEKKRLEQAFANTRAIYTPIREAVSDKKINKDGIVIDAVSLIDGSVTAGISTTFCITRIEGVSPAKINDVILELNETVESYKAGRKGLKSTGLIHGDFLEP